MTREELDELRRSGEAVAPDADAVEAILFWPIRIEATGDLYSKRTDDKTGPAVWLKRYASWIEENGKGRCGKTWDRLEDPFAEKFGVPKLYSDAQSYAEFVYFHPFIERVLYEKDPARRVMEVLVRRDITHLDITLSDGLTQHLLEVRRAQMFLFFTDLAVVAVQVRVSKAISMEGAIELLDQCRRVYAPYYSQDGTAGNFPVKAAWSSSAGCTQSSHNNSFDGAVSQVIGKRRPPLAGHWQELICPLLPWAGDESLRGGKDGLFFRQLGDERAFVMSHIACDAIARLPERYHYGLALLDGMKDGWFYSPLFLRKSADAMFYDRFWLPELGKTTRYAITDYSFVALSEHKTWFVENILVNHFQQHYFFLVLLAVAQKSSMLIAWERLSDLLREFANSPPDDASRKKFHDRHKGLAEDLADYVGQFEFSEVSTQIQPKELFRMLRAQMGCGALLDELIKQFEFARNVEQSNFQEKESQNQSLLQEIANFFIPAALALSLLGMTIGMNGLDAWLQGPDFKWNWPLIGRDLAAVGLALVVSYAIYNGYKFLRKKKWWNGRQ